MPDDARMLLGLAPCHPAGLDHLSASGRAEILAVYPSQSSAMTDMRKLASNAREIDVLAVRAVGIVGLNDSLLRASVQRGTPTVRALLLDPDCEAAQRRAAEIGEEFHSFASGIRLSIARLRELNEETGTVCCYLYTMLPTWRMICLDGTMFVSAFGETTRDTPRRCTDSPAHPMARCTEGSVGSPRSYSGQLVRWWEAMVAVEAELKAIARKPPAPPRGAVTAGSGRTLNLLRSVLRLPRSSLDPRGQRTASAHHHRRTQSDPQVHVAHLQRTSRGPSQRIQTRA